jgi:hypothetical protein
MKRQHLKNIAGIILGFFILFFGPLFALWQLDMIVTGPVWWSSEPMGLGVGWSHAVGAYANDYFQCFLWKTTIGQAYDTLFLIAYATPIIGAIIIFISVWYWEETELNKNKIKELEITFAESEETNDDDEDIE